MASQRLLITGGAGRIASLVRPRLRRPGRVLRLLDTALPAPAGPDEAVEVVTGSITDGDRVVEACADVDAVIHLAGYSGEHTWDRILEVNIGGTRSVLEAARHAGVGRVVLASSNHAAGFRPLSEAGPSGLPADSPPRPDTYYGVSKAAMEALGSLYHSRFGMDILCLRIGSCFERPPGVRGLSTWLSPDDCARLLECCIAAPSPGYRVLWGVSDNTRRVFSLAEAEALGYRPQDDAEVFAHLVDDAPPPGDHVGGPFVTAPLGEPR